MSSGSTSFRSLPRRSATPTSSNSMGHQPVPLQTTKDGHQTLPLKSNLKKSTVSGGSQKLQWHDPDDACITIASLEEMRV